MMKKLSVILTICVLLTVLASVCLAETPVTVSSIEALLAAVHDGAVIDIAPGEYIIPETLEYASWDDFDESMEGEDYFDFLTKAEAYGTLLIQNVNGLTLRAKDNGLVHIMTERADAPVLTLSECTNVIIEGLTLGHDVPEYSCGGEGDVIELESCTDVDILNCDLYGCGVFGLFLHQDNEGIRVGNTTIRDCMNGAVTFESEWLGSVRFDNCRFENNAYDRYSAQLCALFDGYLFGDYEGPIPFTFNGCTFTGNMNTTLAVGTIEAAFNNCTFENNEWETAIKIDLLYDYGYGEVYPERLVFEDQRPVIVNDRTLVPLRAIFEALGATVDWDDATQTVTSTRGDVTISLAIGSNTLYKNGEAITLDVPAQLINDRTMVPVRAISEAFGCKVGWDDATQTVSIAA